MLQALRARLHKGQRILIHASTVCTGMRLLPHLKTEHKYSARQTAAWACFQFYMLAQLPANNTLVHVCTRSSSTAGRQRIHENVYSKTGPLLQALKRANLHKVQRIFFLAGKGGVGRSVHGSELLSHVSPEHEYCASQVQLVTSLHSYLHTVHHVASAYAAGTEEGQPA